MKYLWYIVVVIVLALPSLVEAGILSWAIASRRADRQDSVGFASSRRHPRARAYRTGRLIYRDVQNQLGRKK